MKCPSCGTDETGAFCSRCGRKLISETYTCPATKEDGNPCGCNLTQACVYCPGCGWKVDPKIFGKKTHTACRNCKALLEGATKVCSKCGALQEDAPSVSQQQCANKGASGTTQMRKNKKKKKKKKHETAPDTLPSQSDSKQISENVELSTTDNTNKKVENVCEGDWVEVNNKKKKTSTCKQNIPNESFVVTKVDEIQTDKHVPGHTEDQSDTTLQTNYSKSHASDSSEVLTETSVLRVNSLQVGDKAETPPVGTSTFDGTHADETEGHSMDSKDTMLMATESVTKVGTKAETPPVRTGTSDGTLHETERDSMDSKYSMMMATGRVGAKAETPPVGTGTSDGIHADETERNSSDSKDSMMMATGSDGRTANTQPVGTYNSDGTSADDNKTKITVLRSTEKIGAKVETPPVGTGKSDGTHADETERNSMDSKDSMMMATGSDGTTAERQYVGNSDDTTADKIADKKEKDSVETRDTVLRDTGMDNTATERPPVGTGKFDGTHEGDRDNNFMEKKDTTLGEKGEIPSQNRRASKLRLLGPTNTSDRLIRIIFHAVIDDGFNFNRDIHTVQLMVVSGIENGYYVYDNLERVCSVRRHQSGRYHVTFDGLIPKTTTVSYSYCIASPGEQTKWEYYLNKNGNRTNRSITVETEDECHRFDGIILNQPAVTDMRSWKLLGPFWKAEHRNHCKTTILMYSKEFIETSWNCFADLKLKFKCLHKSACDIYVDHAGCWKNKDELLLKTHHWILDEFLKNIQLKHEDTEKRVCLSLAAVLIAFELKVPLVVSATTHLTSWQQICTFLLIRPLDERQNPTEIEIGIKYCIHSVTLQKALVQLASVLARYSNSPSWLFLMPWIHFLFKKCAPYDVPTKDVGHANATPTWWGTAALEKDAISYFTSKSMAWSIPTQEVLQKLERLFEMDYLLPRSFMAAISIQQLKDVIDTQLIPVEICMAHVYYRLRIKDKMTFKKAISTLRAQIEESTVSHHPNVLHLHNVLSLDLLDIATKHGFDVFSDVAMIRLSCLVNNFKAITNMTPEAQLELDGVIKQAEESANHVGNHLSSTLKEWHGDISKNLLEFNKYFGKLKAESVTETWNNCIGICLKLRIESDILSSKSQNVIKQFVDTYIHNLDCYNADFEEVLTNIVFQIIEGGHSIDLKFTGPKKQHERFGNFLSDLFCQKWVRLSVAADCLERDCQLLQWPPFQQYMYMYETGGPTFLTEQCQQHIRQLTVDVLEYVQRLYDGTLSARTLCTLQRYSADISSLCERIRPRTDRYKRVYIEKALEVRQKEFTAFQTQIQEVETVLRLLKRAQPYMEIVRDEMKQLVTKMNQDLQTTSCSTICNIKAVEEVHDIDTFLPSIKKYSLSDIALDMLPDSASFEKSTVFLSIWDECCTRDDVSDVTTMDQVVERVFQPAMKRLRELCDGIKTGDILIGQFEQLIGNNFGESYDGMTSELQRLGISMDHIQDRIEQLKVSRQMITCMDMAKTLMDIVKDNKLEIHDSQISIITKQKGGTELRMRSFDSAFMDMCKVLGDVTDTQIHCISAIRQSKPLVDWLRESLTQSEELKVFIDLAMTSCGDEPKHIRRVQWLHSAVTGYAPLIFDVQTVNDDNGLLQKCQLVWKTLEVNTKLPEQLMYINNQLDWLKGVKQAHGAVEMNSLLQAEAINKSSKYVVGNEIGLFDDGSRLRHGRNTQDIEHIISLTVYGKTDGGGTFYKFQQVQDLQSRLMLVAGKKDLASKTVERFTNILESVTRLAKIYLKLDAAGCVLFKDWSAFVHCDVGREACVEFKFGKSSNPLVGRKSIDGDVEKILLSVAQLMENCLQEWLNHIKEKRREYIHLNYFTVRQLVLLQRELVEMDDGPTNLVYPLLSAVRENCTQDDLRHASVEAKLAVDKKNGAMLQSPAQTQTLSIDPLVFKQSLIDKGCEENLAEFYVVHTKETDPDKYDIDKALQWCFDHEDDYLEEAEQYNKEQADYTTIEELIQNSIADDDGEKNPTLVSSMEQLWNSFIFSISSNVKDYLSLEHLGLILRCLAKRNERKIERSVPTWVAEKEPNLVICARDDVFNVALTLYMFDGSQQLPSTDEVLLCTEKTSIDEVDIFLRRALFDGGGKKIHCIINAEALSFSVCQDAEKLLEEYLRERKSFKDETAFRLIFICDADKEYKSSIISTVDKFRRHVSASPTHTLQSYITSKMHPCGNADSNTTSNAILVMSTRAGVGKSLYTKRRYQRMTKPDRDVEQHGTVTIPLQEKCVDIGYVMQRLLPYTVSPNVTHSRLVHIDVYHEVQEGVDFLLFHLLILSCLMDPSGYVWRRSKHDLYLIECMPIFKQQQKGKKKSVTFYHPTLAVLPTVVCKSPLESLNMYATDGFKDTGTERLFDKEEFHSAVFQRPYKYLYEMEKNDKPFAAIKTSEKICLQTLLRYCGTNDPSWAELHNFISFLDTQLSDFERCIFVAPENRDVLPGFDKFVLGFLIEMSRDFSTRSLIIHEESQSMQENHEQLDNTLSDDLKKFQMRRTWESSPHPYLFFNSDHITFTFLGFHIERSGKLIDHQSKRPIVNAPIMSTQLFDSLRLNGVPMTENFDELPRQEKIQRLCKVMGVKCKYKVVYFQKVEGIEKKNEHIRINDPDETYELTTDNVKKILAIYMRFRCNIPVIIMGETGCGKTRLVKFLCDLQNPGSRDGDHMIIVKVNGGTTKQDILRNFQYAECKAAENIKQFGKKTLTVLFFDEANTTEAIGMIKEIMCDGTVQGSECKLSKNLKLVAACNPYRKHSPEMIERLERAGLGYHVRAEKTKDYLGNVPMRRLVYRVQPLPQSLLPLVWDFGQLNTQVETLYIKQMVKRYTDPAVGGTLDISLTFQKPSTLLVNIRGAKNLAPQTKDGSACSCVNVSVSGCEKMFRTEVKENTTNPTWAEIFTFDLPFDELENRFVEFNVLDKTAHSNSNSLGQCIVELGRLSREPEIKTCLKLSDLVKKERLPAIDGMNDTLSKLLTACNAYMRQQEDECSFVSLRDIDRVLTIAVWFYQQSKQNRTLFNEMDAIISSSNKKTVADVTRSLVLAIGVCYHACLKTRDEFRSHISRFFCKPCISYGKDKIKEEIEICQDVFLNNLILEDNIARNMALKENVFMMAICIELRIPLFLVGKPGSSKSLAKTIVSSAMQGNSSNKKLFKHMKQVHMISFQCSPLATPELIVGTFRQCAHFQKDKDTSTFVSVVVLDEVELAEDSPRMPLKTLHPLLESGYQEDETLTEQPMNVAYFGDEGTTTTTSNSSKMQPIFERVGFIGISNWALDSAKMNRGILVQRDVPDLQELENSAVGICQTSPKHVKWMKYLIKPLAKSYLEVFEKATDTIREFYGLRDFYSLVKMVYNFVKRDKTAPSWHKMLYVIKRNFGGLEDLLPEDTFKKHLDDYLFIDDEMTPSEGDPDCSPVGLINACLFDTYNMNSVSRYLLLITENYGTLSFIEQQISRAKPIIIFGSSFHSDQEYTQVCRNIHRIKVCMETGQTVVLLNLDNLYESLYDALNQHYEYCGGDRFVDLGLGTHRVKVPVHSEFRLIVVAEKQKVYDTFPIPLINRLEKHFFMTNALLSKKHQAIVEELNRWTSAFIWKRANRFDLGTVFIGYHDDTCSAVVLHACEDLGQDFDQAVVTDRAKESLLWTVTPESVVALQESRLSTKESTRLNDVYFKNQRHDNVFQFLQFMLVARNCDKLRVQITTHSKLLVKSHKTKVGTAAGMSPTDVLLIENLSAIDTEQEFSKRIRQHLETSPKSIIVIQCDSGDVNADLIACARYCVMDEIEKMVEMERNTTPLSVHVVFIVQLPRVAGGCFSGFQCGTWKSVHIDELYTEHTSEPSLSLMRGKSIAALFAEAVEQFNSEEIGPHRRTDGNEASITHDTEEITECPFNVIAFLRGCVQAAVAAVKDMTPETEHDLGQETANQNVDFRSRATKRVRFMLEFLDDGSEKEEVATFSKWICQLVSNLLIEKESTTTTSALAEKWLTKIAAEPENVTKSGAFRRSCVKILRAKTTPIFAGLICFLDTNFNLDQLENNAMPWKRKLWLTLLSIQGAVKISYSQLTRPNTEQELTEFMVRSTSSQGGAYHARFPFSWLIMETISGTIKQCVPTREDDIQRTMEKFENIIKNDPVGMSLATFDIFWKDKFAGQADTLQILLEEYIYDLVQMKYTAKSDHERKTVEDLIKSTLPKETSENSILYHLIQIHWHFERNTEQLVYFRDINDIWPECSTVIQGDIQANDKHSIFATNGLVLHSTHLIIREMDIKDYDSKNGTDWLAKVQRFRPTVEKIIGHHMHHQQCEESVTIMLHSARSLWTRVVVFKLFLEHCKESSKLNLNTLWSNLGVDADMKSEKSFAALDKFLRTLNAKALKTHLNGVLKCVDCENPLTQAPTLLPCESKHAVCKTCYEQMKIDQTNQCKQCSTIFEKGWNPPTLDENKFKIKEFVDFQTRCNTFFMDVVSQLCFSENSPPSFAVTKKLLEYSICTTKKQEISKDLAIIETGIDPNPVFRSFLLRHILRSSNPDITEPLDECLRSAQQSFTEDTLNTETQKVDLSMLIIHCLEDIAVERSTDSLSDIEERVQRAFQAIQDEQLPYLDKLYGLADARFVLRSVAIKMAELVQLPIEKPVSRAYEALFEMVKPLCTDVRCKWARNYLVKYLCRRYSLGVYHTVIQYTRLDMSWICFETDVQPEMPDRYTLCGKDYQNVKQMLIRGIAEESFVALSAEIKKLRDDGRDATQVLHLAIHKEVTLQFGKGNIPGTALKAMENFIQTCAFIQDKSLVYSLIRNRLQPEQLIVSQDNDQRNAGLQCLLLHFSTTMTTLKRNKTLLAPFTLLWSAPQKLENSYFPTMPQDDLDEIMVVFLASKDPHKEQAKFYRCRNGHAYVITECGVPYIKGKCMSTGCGEEIGGSLHKLLESNTKADGVIRQQKGHILGTADNRSIDILPERNMSPAYTVCLRLLLHMAMFSGISKNEKDIRRLIHPTTEGDTVSLFLWRHIGVDIDHLAKAVGRSLDDVLLLMHYICSSMGTNEFPDVPKASTFSTLSSKDDRREWEDHICKTVLSPVFQNIDTILGDLNASLASDANNGSSFLRMLFESDEVEEEKDKKQVLHQVPRVWRYRTEITIDQFRQSFASKIGLPKEGDDHYVLHVFLSEHHHLRLLQYIPSILRLQRSLFAKYYRRLDKIEAAKITIQQLITEEVAGADTITLINDFKEAWETVKDALKHHVCRTEKGALVLDDKYGNICFDESTPVTVLLPTLNDAGLCSFVLLDFLFRKHNQMLELYWQEAKRSTSSPPEIHPMLVNSAHLISYDAQRDLLPLILANSKYNFEMGGGTKIAYDFAGMERQLIDRYISPKSKVYMGSQLQIRKMVYMTEFTDAAVLRELNKKIPQDALPTATKAQISEELKVLPELCRCQDQLDIAISFLKTTGGNPKDSIYRFMKRTLQMENALMSQKARLECEFRHLQSLWLLLSLQKSKKMTDNNQSPKAIFKTLQPTCFEELLLDDQERFKKCITQALPVDKMSQLVAILHEYILLMVAEVKNSESEDYQETTEKSLGPWVQCYVSQVYDDEILLPLDRFPDQILGKHVVHTWTLSYKALKERLLEIK